MDDEIRTNTNITPKKHIMRKDRKGSERKLHHAEGNSRKSYTFASQSSLLTIKHARLPLLTRFTLYAYGEPLPLEAQLRVVVQPPRASSNSITAARG